MNPKVSVIIPTYNRATLVGKAIQSVLDQTFTDFEVIVVDDGSTDNTRDVVSKFGEKVKYIYQENLERSAARNNGMKSSRGEYITFLDSDDLYLPCKLQIQAGLMDTNPDYGMSYSSSVWLDEDGKYLHTWRDNLNGWIYPEMMRAKHNKIAVPSVMIRKSILANVGYFDESINTCEDYEYWCRIAKKYPVLQIRKALVIIMTGMQPSPEIFYTYFKSTLAYYKHTFSSDPPVKDTMKRIIYTDLAKKYYLNSSSAEERIFVLSEIKKIGRFYDLLTITKAYYFKLSASFKKYNGVRTLLTFFNNYLLIRLPKSIAAEEFDYAILRKLESDKPAQQSFRGYLLNDTGDMYLLKASLERERRKEIRNIFLRCNFWHKNRIASILNL